MNHTRHLSYRSVLRTLAGTPEWLLDRHERERLRDLAEGLLLTSDGEEAHSLRRDAALALSLLVGQKRWHEARADRLWEDISDCGPARAVAPAA